MYRTSLAALALALCLPLAAGAQQRWTAEQTALWEWEQACWAATTIEALSPCFHDQFEGWGLNSTVPTTKMDRRPYQARDLANTPIVFLAMKPLSIRIQGDIAIILYLATYTTRNRTTGEEETTTERWTDIAMRQGTSWAWIADHGVRLPGN